MECILGETEEVSRMKVICGSVSRTVRRGHDLLLVGVGSGGEDLGGEDDLLSIAVIDT
jgi:hypothetical protein